ncbi:hypothetical protein QAD02_008452 [Eretmocerus hayati]|uniref:Uncharacterized protein n=1 Tax=Eretmocerus hayati TaxID=131215 RepID=A0ACC2N6G5_9HYME|nr:hypothetical protein QAD02_008452 [Eretmocerus hayati]
METQDPPESQSDIASTLESEIDALSRIITDTRDAGQISEGNEDEFKLDNDGIPSSESQYDALKAADGELLQDAKTKINFNILHDESSLPNESSESNSQEEIKVTSGALRDISQEETYDSKHSDISIERCQDIVAKSGITEDLASKLITERILATTEFKTTIGDVKLIAKRADESGQESQSRQKVMSKDADKLGSIQIFGVADGENEIIGSASKSIMDTRDNPDQIQSNAILKSEHTARMSSDDSEVSNTSTEREQKSVKREINSAETRCIQDFDSFPDTELFSSKYNFPEDDCETKAFEQKLEEHSNSSQAGTVHETEDFAMVNCEITGMIESAKPIQSMEKLPKMLGESEHHVSQEVMGIENPNSIDSGSMVSEEVISNVIHDDFDDEIHQVHIGKGRLSMHLKLPVSKKCNYELIESSREISSIDENQIGMKDTIPAKICSDFDDMESNVSGGECLLQESLGASDSCVDPRQRAHNPKSCAQTSDDIKIEPSGYDLPNLNAAITIDLDNASVVGSQRDENLAILNVESEKVISLKDPYEDGLSTLRICKANSPNDENEEIQDESPHISDDKTYQSVVSSVKQVDPEHPENKLKTKDQSSQEPLEHVIETALSSDGYFPPTILPENSDIGDGAKEQIPSDLDSHALNLSLQDSNPSTQTNKRESSPVLESETSVTSDIQCVDENSPDAQLSSITSNPESKEINASIYVDETSPLPPEEKKTDPMLTMEIDCSQFETVGERSDQDLNNRSSKSPKSQPAQQSEELDDLSNPESLEFPQEERGGKFSEELPSDTNNYSTEAHLTLIDDGVTEVASVTLKLTDSENSASSSKASESNNDKQEELEIMNQQDRIVKESKISSILKEACSVSNADHNSEDEEPTFHAEKTPQDSDNNKSKVLHNLTTTENREELPKPSLKSTLPESPTVEVDGEGMSGTSDSNNSPPEYLRPEMDAVDESLYVDPASDTSKRDSSDKQQQHITESENLGSPRIILKIAKSAITECSEPRSPKSPKIRPTVDSPNPEDSPGHKLGKIKLKLSKRGHPSIISNDNYDESAQWHTDTLSPHSSSSMKMKFTKTLESEDTQKLEDNRDKSSLHVDENKKCETPIGMKIKISKSGDASIAQTASREINTQDTETKKLESSPIGVKIKLSKTGDASIIQQSCNLQSATGDENAGSTRTHPDTASSRKMKLSKPNDSATLSKEDLDIKKGIDSRDSTHDPSKKMNTSSIVKIKVPEPKGINTLIATEESCQKQSENDSISNEVDETSGSVIDIKTGSSIVDDSSILPSEAKPISDINKKLNELPIGMKIKLSRTGDPSVILLESSKEEESQNAERPKVSKHKDHGSTSQKLREEAHLEMKIKLPKNGHPTIITSNDQVTDSIKIPTTSMLQPSTQHDPVTNESIPETLKKAHVEETIDAAETSAAIQMFDLHNKRREITIAPIDSKKSKSGSGDNQILPAISIQPISVRKKGDPTQEQKLMLDSNRGSISQQQMNVINQEISIPQIRPSSTDDVSKGERLKKALKALTGLSSSPLNSDCEIIDSQPELIIVNENSNSNQDVMIIDEVPPKAKVARKRGRPRRNPIPPTQPALSSTPGIQNSSYTSSFQNVDTQRDPLSIQQPSLHVIQQIQQQLHQQQQLQQSSETTSGSENSERPRRTCRSQKSYAPPKRGRGRGRGKRKNETTDIPTKKVCIDQDLTAIEAAATARIPFERTPAVDGKSSVHSREIFKALSASPTEMSMQHLKGINIIQTTRSEHSSPNEEVTPSSQVRMIDEGEVADVVEEVMELDIPTAPNSPSPDDWEPSIDSSTDRDTMRVSESYMKCSSDDLSARADKSGQFVIKMTSDSLDVASEQALDPNEEMKDNQDQQNWLTPSTKRMPSERDNLSSLTVIDEETRMSAESCSRSQTPARTMSATGMTETLLNEESQGSVLSTATTESERVKVQRTRRMEINVDPDEGPLTVERIAEYEWPIDRGLDRGTNVPRGETYMIQEQISQYLGVKSFKRKYPDLKRRMVDMEERNYLRENGLVSESLCDMGLTAISSAEVLDIMCSDFPEQYEEYRRFIRERAAKEHSKKQKELSAAANAERSRIDLAEMAMQSALSWNTGFNKARKDTRKFSLDLQTFTVQVPKRPLKPDSAKRSHNYPVALIPGQYTDFYREYTPAELRYYPLNTVLYGPMRPNQRKFDCQSEGTQSDSDSDSSFDDSSYSSSVGTQGTEESQSTMEEVDLELAVHSGIKCKICSNQLNKNNRPEVLIQCGTCSGSVHPSCTDLTLDMVPHIRAYSWQCTDCKTCAQCHDPADEDKMLFCDMCDRGYHIYCVGLRRVPQGRWHCQECAICATCGTKDPAGANPDKNNIAQWQHEYRKSDKALRVYVATYCVPCSK